MDFLTSLDPTVTIALSAANDLTIGLVVLAAARNYPMSLSKALLIFGGGKLLLGGGLFLAMLRHEAPIFVSIVLANALGIVGVYSNYSAVRALQGKTWAWPGACIVTAVTFVSALWFTDIHPDLRGLRFVTGMVSIGVLCFVAIELLFHYRRPGWAHYMNAAAALILAVTLVMRTMHWLMVPPIPLGAPFMAPRDSIEALAWCILNLTTSMVSVTFVLMVGDVFNETLARLAGTDPLTGLANRRCFYERGERALAQAWRLGRSLSLLLIDIDHFKLINDSHGHLGGDRALRALAACLEGAVRETDLAGRLGGEEFAVLLPDTDLAEAMTCAEALRARVAAMIIRGDEAPPLRMTLSIGVATETAGYPVAPSLDRLLAWADRAMYAAKSAGRNRVIAACPAEGAAPQAETAACRS